MLAPSLPVVAFASPVFDQSCSAGEYGEKSTAYRGEDGERNTVGGRVGRVAIGAGVEEGVVEVVVVAVVVVTGVGVGPADDE